MSLVKLAKTMAKFFHEYKYKFGGLLSIKTNVQRVRQQDIFAVRDDVTQFRHREVRWEGLIMFSE
jgi:hypothetical protein